MRTRAVIAGLLLISPFALSACKQESSAPVAHSSAQPSASTPPTTLSRQDVYTGIRGVVTMLPIAGRHASELKIQHEQIPAFRNKDGEIGVNMRGVPGMASMVMPFPIAQGLDISDLSIGDKIAFDFTVYWGGPTDGPKWEITRFEKLNPATELDFSNTTIQDAADHAHDHDGHDHSGHNHP